ncbi:MAG: zinc-ribbon domain-containing protein [Chloroflexota bacterium]
MSQTCPKCGFLNRATNRFCSNCGVTLVPVTDAPTDTTASASTAPPTRTGADGQPVTYVVQRWDAPEGIVDPPVATPKTPGDTPPMPTFAPYSGYTPDTPTSSHQTPPVLGQPTQPTGPTMMGVSRTEGGTYAPYSADAERKLEKQKPERAWLLPSVAVASLLVLILVGIGGYLWLMPRSGGTGTNAQTVPSNATTDEGKIQDVIRRSNDEQITAWRTLDTEILKGTRTGQVLIENIQAVEELKNKQMYAIPENKSLVFGDIQINGNTATAKTVEVWTVTFYSKSDNKVVLATGPDKLHETYHLVKQGDQWLVSTLDIERDGTPGTPGTPTTGDV